jgi:hypothetical protein
LTFSATYNDDPIPNTASKATIIPAANDSGSHTLLEFGGYRSLSSRMDRRILSSDSISAPNSKTKIPVVLKKQVQTEKLTVSTTDAQAVE